MRPTLAVAAVVAAVAGCGGGGDSGDIAGSSSTKSTTVAQGTATTTTTTTTSEDDGEGGARLREQSTDPRTAVEAFLTSSDAADRCGSFVTKRFLFRAYGGPHACSQARPPANQLEFKSVSVDGDRARAVVVPSGGPYDGERMTVSLVRYGSRWAVDGLDANVPVGP